MSRYSYTASIEKIKGAKVTLILKFSGSSSSLSIGGTFGMKLLPNGYKLYFESIKEAKKILDQLRDNGYISPQNHRDIFDELTKAQPKQQKLEL